MIDLSKPLSHDQMGKAKTQMIPDFVFKAVNELLISEYTGGTTTIYQSTIVSKICEINLNVTRSQIFENGWLNFEDAYREMGWCVTYDYPAYCEDYDANFKFKRKK